MFSPVTSPAPFPSSCAINPDRLKPCPIPPAQDSSSQLGEDDVESITYLPGNPAIGLTPDEVHQHVEIHLNTPVLDDLYDKMWLVAKKSSSNVDPLHTQKVKGRCLVPTEDPRLHLVWERDKIYIKPVPEFLLNHEFWVRYLQPSAAAHTAPMSLPQTCSRSVATGFLRTYSLLVQHPLDLALAQESHLISKEVGWLQWCKFISHFRRIEDQHVAKRYHYGQLRMSRLNWAVRIFQPQNASNAWFYEIPYWSTTDFVIQFTIPFLFVFAIVSVALSCMQVALSVPEDQLWVHLGLRNMDRAFWVFSIAVLFFSVIVGGLFLVIPLIALFCQLVWGYLHRDRTLATDQNGAKI